MQLFSKKTERKHIIYNFLGIKFSAKNKEYHIKENEALLKEIAIQNSWDLSDLKNAKKLILFLTPGKSKINGGVMSIYSLCETSRDINKDSVCILSTYPNEKYTYATNNTFANNEKIYRFSQIVENSQNLEQAIIHIPDYYAKDFYSKLKKEDIQFLKSIKELQINILNQNIELMPKPNDLKDLYKLTANITQTIAHNRYATQDLCNKFNIPTHLFSVNIDLSKYKSYHFEEKEKIIVLSPDDNEYKKNIIGKLKNTFTDWKFITVQNMTFSEYMDLISKAYFTITFGEGMDGYFTQPQSVGSVGFAVYNDNFFPNTSWKELLNVYKSYDEMLVNITDDMKKLLNNKDLYTETIKLFLEKHSNLYKIDKFKDNLTRFYEKNYDFFPKQECINYAK